MEEWEVVVKKSKGENGYISVFPRKGENSYASPYFWETEHWEIYPPDAIEKFLNITLEAKVRLAMRECDKLCVKLNKRDLEKSMREKEIDEFIKTMEKL